MERTRIYWIKWIGGKMESSSQRIRFVIRPFTDVSEPGFILRAVAKGTGPSETGMQGFNKLTGNYCSHACNDCYPKHN